MRAVLRWVAIGAGLVLVVTAGLGLAAYRKFSGNIRTDSAAERVLAQYAEQRPRPLVPQARNILVMGSGAAGRRDGGDAAVLLHLAANRARAAAIGVPRDLMVGAPSCRRADGGVSPAAYEPFGDAFRGGGAACSIRAFEALSGIRVDHHLVVDVGGFEKIAAAVGGSGPDRRRDLLRALVREARGGGTLAHPARLYGLLDTATSSITADPGLSSLPALYELAGTLRALPADGLVFRTVPVAGDRGPGGGSGQGAQGDPVRQPDAGRLFAALRADLPVGPGPES